MRGPNKLQLNVHQNNASERIKCSIRLMQQNSFVALKIVTTSSLCLAFGENELLTKTKGKNKTWRKKTSSVRSNRMVVSVCVLLFWKQQKNGKNLKLYLLGLFLFGITDDYVAASVDLLLLLRWLLFSDNKNQTKPHNKHTKKKAKMWSDNTISAKLEHF